jgi:hypothetical protein
MYIIINRIELETGNPSRSILDRQPGIIAILPVSGFSKTVKNSA